MPIWHWQNFDLLLYLCSRLRSLLCFRSRSRPRSRIRSRPHSRRGLRYGLRCGLRFLILAQDYERCESDSFVLLGVSQDLN
jgi:hypothetical protein